VEGVWESRKMDGIPGRDHGKRDQALGIRLRSARSRGHT